MHWQLSQVAVSKVSKTFVPIPSFLSHFVCFYFEATEYQYPASSGRPESSVCFSATAWSSPRNIPGWVLKRVRPLTAEQVQEVAWMENLTAN